MTDLLLNFNKTRVYVYHNLECLHFTHYSSVKSSNKLTTLSSSGTNEECNEIILHESSSLLKERPCEKT